MTENGTYSPEMRFLEKVQEIIPRQGKNLQFKKMEWINNHVLGK
jgi:hypothetical protein